MNKTFKILLVIFIILENVYLLYVVGVQTQNSQYYRNQMLELCQMYNQGSKIINDQSDLLSRALETPKTANDLEELNCVSLLVD